MKYCLKTAKKLEKATAIALVAGKSSLCVELFMYFYVYSSIVLFNDTWIFFRMLSGNVNIFIKKKNAIFEQVIILSNNTAKNL